MVVGGLFNAFAFAGAGSGLAGYKVYKMVKATGGSRVKSK